MSKIQEKPFIQEVAENIGSSLRASLLNLVNGSEKTPAFRSLVNPNNYITDADKNKASYITLETWNRVYTGYLVYNSSYCVLIAYTTNTEALVILDINISKMTYKIVKQPLSILELRFVLQEAQEMGDVVEEVQEALDGGTLKIKAHDITSGSEQEGRVLVSDGLGGAVWTPIENLLYNDFVLGHTLFSKRATVSGTTVTLVGTVSGNTVVLA